MSANLFRSTACLALLGCLVLMNSPEASGFGRGGGGGGGFGGGGGRGGGGGFGGGGASRPAPSRSPSMSRPAPSSRPSPSRPSASSRPSGPSRPSMPSRPSQGSRPSGGGNRPSGQPALANRPSQPSRPSGSGSSRPSTGVGSSLPDKRPGVVTLPNGSSRPGNVTRPSRPEIADRPSTLPGTVRPNVSDRPGLTNRPVDRPTTLPGNLPPGLGNRPGQGNLPGLTNRPGLNNRPGTDRPTTLPGLANRPGQPNWPGQNGNGANWNNRPNNNININNNNLTLNNRQEWLSNRTEYRSDRVSNLNDRMTDRSGYRNNQFQDWSENHWDHHCDWDHGHWDCHQNSWWNHMWDEHPVAMGFGVTAWGVNRLSYWFGYSGYYNPYATAPVQVSGDTYINYSEPLQTYSQVYEPAPEAATQVASPPPSASGSAAPQPGTTDDPLTELSNQARSQFSSGDYPSALQSVQQALTLAKNDAVLHELRAMTLFALGQYQDAAATIHSVLAVGPGWDWTTVSGLYPAVDVYTAQLRLLESAVKAKPEAAELRFLLAYHYVVTNANNAAIKQFQEVVRLQPKDVVALQMLEMIGGPAALPPSVSKVSQPPKPAGDMADTEVVALAVKDLVGSWNASGTDGSTFQLALTAENTFTWTFKSGDQQTSVEGVFAIEENTLALEPDAGGTMVAELSDVKGKQFHFQMVGAPPGDAGLRFTK